MPKEIFQLNPCMPRLYYGSRNVRCYLTGRGIRAMIPRKRDERPQRWFNRGLYCEHNQVERLINRLKEFRRVATRYEKLAANSLAMVTLAAIMMWRKAAKHRATYPLCAVRLERNRCPLYNAA